MPVSEYENPRFVNSLRLSEKDEQEIMTALMAGGENPPGSERRRDKRLPYQTHAGLVVQMRHPGGSIANYLVRVRNISKDGIGFLHGAFVYTGTRCSMTLLTRSNKPVRLEGRIIRCRHVSKHIHEVGVRFEKPIRLGDFVAGALRMGADVESSRELPRFSGQILSVEDSVSDQELLTFHLANVGVTVKGTSNVLAAIELTSQFKFDAVMTNVWLPAMSGLELVDYLRQTGYKNPIIALTADGRDEVRQDALNRGCTAVVIKPYHFEELLSVLDPYLVHVDPNQGAQVLLSELWADERMRPLITSYLTRLRVEFAEMQRLVETGKPSAGLRKLCMDIKGSAGSYGFRQISEAAQIMLDLVMIETPGADLKGPFEALAELGRSACSILDKTASNGKTAAGVTKAA